MGNAVIVGHGPSMLAGNLGDEIDSYDTVIRLKRCHETLKHPHIYGSKTDIVGGSWNIAKALIGIGKATKYWAFVDSRHPNINEIHVDALKKDFEPYELECSIKECRFWDDMYVNMRTPMDLHHQMKGGDHSSEGFGHNHLSQGLKAMIYAGKFLKPDLLTLAGFDNVMTGNFEWSITRGPDYGSYADHNWAVENKMAALIADHYDMRLNFLVPEAEI